MSRIEPDILNCVFYLYPTEEAAARGARLGGSGFWVSVAAETIPNYYWVYAVSNRHVVHRDGCSIIRANQKSGGFAIVSSDPLDWTEHPAGHDIAVCHVGNAEMLSKIDYSTVPTTRFVHTGQLTEQVAPGISVGIGDDVYIVGRFINHEGKLKNTPSARFGNISMLPGEPIFVDSNTAPQESFAVELRSMCGYSGSPAFVDFGGARRVRREHVRKHSVYRFFSWRTLGPYHRAVDG